MEGGVIVTIKMLMVCSAMINAAYPCYQAAKKVHGMVGWYRELVAARTPQEPWIWVERSESKG